MKKTLHAKDVREWLIRNRSEKYRLGLARFGMNPDRAIGVSMGSLRSFARQHAFAPGTPQALWKVNKLESRVLAALITDPKTVPLKLLNQWVREIDNWGLCDTFTGSLVEPSPHCESRIMVWTKSRSTFTKRAGFATIAWHAVHDKTKPDHAFHHYFELIERESTDDRHYVKKAVDWALRQIGKRSQGLRKQALNIAEGLLASDSPSAKWIGRETKRELSKG